MATGKGVILSKVRLKMRFVRVRFFLSESRIITDDMDYADFGVCDMSSVFVKVLDFAGFYDL